MVNFLFISFYLIYFLKDYFIEWNKKRNYWKRCIFWKVCLVILIEWEEFLLVRFMKEDMGIDCIIKFMYKIGIILIYD